MPKLDDEYLANLAELKAYTGGRMMMSIKEVSAYTGRTERFVKEYYEIPRAGITLPSLARRMCERR